MSNEVNLDSLACAQLGLLTRAQALALLGERGLGRAEREGRLTRVQKGVFRCAGTPPSFRQRALAACLACGEPVAVSHTSAARLWTFEGVAPARSVHVTVPRSRSGRRDGLVVHRARLTEHEVADRFGIPVTSVSRTLLDLAAAGLAEAVIGRCVDDALRRRLAEAEALRRWLDAEGGGRPGSKALRRFVMARVEGGVGDSVGVDRVVGWIAGAGLPAPVCNYPVIAGGRQRFLDIAYPTWRIAIEFNGWEYHQMRSRMDDDHARTSDLELEGWLVIVVTAAHTEVDTVRRIERAIAIRSRGLERRAG